MGIIYFGLGLLVLSICGTIYNAMTYKEYNDWRNHTYSTFVAAIGTVVCVIGLIIKLGA